MINQMMLLFVIFSVGNYQNNIKKHMKLKICMAPIKENMVTDEKTRDIEYRHRKHKTFADFIN